ncbi:MICOS complex subunit Mic10-like [Lingula anatina]|uniref:MICOS complex subunit MIC10 n=1 Tax=Lingula anatina TaxID=7574 RepID=A0A1S3JU49_LINAN|nr:MICOS complex subunit Mic10-like [Lingula anatina]|eukprot:XP_013413621.1 MICOS complex subunit Mic10-like [Lingula anatina]
MATGDVRSEDELGEKWDRCLQDGGIKIAGSTAVGFVSSMLLCKRPHAWPLTLGIGIGIGMAFTNCQREFQNPYLLFGQKLKVVKKDTTTQEA